MAVNVHVSQIDNGRWIWSAFEANMAKAEVGFQYSPVEFCSQEEAQADVSRHAAADINKATGRIIEEATYLDYLIALLVAAEPVCAGASFSPVYWHEPDESGANWNVDTVRGADDTPACVDALSFKIEHLRQGFEVRLPVD